MLGALGLIIFFAIVLVIATGKPENRFLAFLFGTVLFPTSALFINNPSISPQHFILYFYFAVEFFKNRQLFFEAIFKNPLRISFLLLLCSYFFSALYNTGTSLKGMYYGLRDFLDSFGYIVAAFIGASQFEVKDFVKKMYTPVIIVCIFGILEILLATNIPYVIVNEGFPIHSGYLSLAGNVSFISDWRYRTNFTTTHPTAFGTLLSTLFAFFIPYLKEQTFKKNSIIILLVLLAINLYLCGSRTAMLCAVLGALVYVFLISSILFKVISAGVFLFSISTILTIAISNFQYSEGSSLDFRERQLVFSFLAIQQSPILGNGTGYLSHELFGDEKRLTDFSGQDVGGMESMIFKLLIDRGILGLFVYYFLFMQALFYFIKNRKEPYVLVCGLPITIAGMSFVTLSGTIGNSSEFIFIFMGFVLGIPHRIKNLEQEHFLPQEK